MEKPNNPDREIIMSRSRRSLCRRASAMSRHESETLQVLALIEAGRAGLAALVLIVRALMLCTAFVTAGLLLGGSALPARAVSALVGLL